MSKLRELVKNLPKDEAAAVAVLGAFEYEPDAPRIEGYYEKESEDIADDSLEELSSMALAGRFSFDVYQRFLDEYLRPGAKKRVKIKK